MAIQLSPEQEQVVGQAIHAGLIREPDDVVEIGIEAIRQRLEAREAAAETLNVAEWSRELHEWISSHSRTTPVLSEEAMSRDSHSSFPPEQQRHQQKTADIAVFPK